MRVPWPVIAGAGLAADRFRRALASPSDAQEAVAARAWRGLDGTWARGDARRWDDVPPRRWDELAVGLAAQRAGEPGLTRAAVDLWERTSGSTGPQKDVPVPRPVIGAFTWMLAVWLGDLLRRGPALPSARLWVSATPALHTPAVAADGVRVGAADDTDYISGWARPLLRRFLVDTADLHKLRDGEAWLCAAADRLLAAQDLGAISVWSPTLLRLVLDRVAARGGSDPRGRAALERRWGEVWPQLRVVSAWGDAMAARPLAGLAGKLPGVLVQPKGLLATEGPVSVPLVGVEGGAPLVDTVLIEVLRDGVLRPITALGVGEGGEIVLSWPGGLCRYRLGDVVEVVGRVGATPTLRLVGRVGGGVDLVGEKLSEEHAARALRVVPSGVWAMLVPSNAGGARYHLWVDRPVDGEVVRGVEAALAGSPTWRTARGLGQLGAVEVVVDPAAPAKWAQSGPARLGDVKDRALAPRPLLD